MIIKLIRHGESFSNIGEAKPHEAGDAGIGLTDRGRQQAMDVGWAIGPDFISQALLYCSPYQRTRETLSQILAGAGVSNHAKIYEDPRLREVERGYADEASQHELRKVHGWFYNRHSGGESAADCYDRTSAFLETFMRQAQRRNATKAMIITHGMTIRCFVTRFLHLTVEQFESMDNPVNCDVITIAPIEQIYKPVFINGRWGADGMSLRPSAARPSAESGAVCNLQNGRRYTEALKKTEETVDMKDNAQREADHLTNIAAVEKLAAEVFDSDEAGFAWLRQPNHVFGDRAPNDLLLRHEYDAVRVVLNAIVTGGVA